MLDRNISIPSIRILPMSDEDPAFTGKSILKAQEWILDELPTRPYYYKVGIKTVPGTLILFQYHAHIIAWALVEEIIDFKRTNPQGYNGGIVFKPETIAVFDQMNKYELKNIWEDFKGFNQSKQSLDISKFRNLWSFVQTRNIEYSHINDNYQENIQKLSIGTNITVTDEPKKANLKGVTSNGKYPRSFLTAKKSIIFADFRCEFDHNHNHFTSEITGRNYVEAHHIIPMKYQYEFPFRLDVEANIVSLCCACHKKIHHSVFEEKSLLIDRLFDLRKRRLELCKIAVDKKKLYQYYQSPSVHSMV
jgi:hypothetical protein